MSENSVLDQMLCEHANQVDIPGMEGILRRCCDCQYLVYAQCQEMQIHIDDVHLDFVYIQGKDGVEYDSAVISAYHDFAKNISSFWMMKYPLTTDCGLYLSYLLINAISNRIALTAPSSNKTFLTNVSPNGITRFIADLNRVYNEIYSQQGTFCLPTSSQWEYVYHIQQIYSQEHIEDAHETGQNRVGMGYPNVFGLYDIGSDMYRHGEICQHTHGWEYLQHGMYFPPRTVGLKEVDDLLGFRLVFVE